jgi:predicted nucleotidyltransferase
MALYDKSHYYVDFSNSNLLSDVEKVALERIQETYRPVERVEFLLEYKVSGKITADQFETMTGLPYDFGI